MDPLSHLLDGPRARGAFALKVLMAPGWAIQVQDQAPLTIMVMLAPRAWIAADGERHELAAGDVALVRGPAPYRVADDPAREADVVILPHQECTTPSGAKVSLGMDRGVRTWGGGSAGDPVLLVGTYATDAQVTAAVASTLPRVAVLPAGSIDPALLAVLEREITTSAPGQGGIIDRLLDVVLVHAVRTWALRHPAATTGWLAGTTDPLVAAALRLFHDEPAEPWTLPRAAARLHVSRATLATRFRTHVGEPPMTYLSNWRLLLASELLADRGLTTASIAARVGYGSPFALSAAFKRRYGISPTAYRSREGAAPATTTD